MTATKRLLLIEDHHDTLEVMRMLLESSGFRVSAYDHCKPAEVHLSSCDFDIALLDVRLPGRCGDDFAKELRANCPKTMIVFLTAEDRVEPLKDAVPDCFVLRKPVDIQMLLDLLRRHDAEDGLGSIRPRSMDDQDRPGTN